MSIFAFMLVAVPTPASAQGGFSPMSPSQIETRLFGKRLTGEYANGTTWAERFNRDRSSDYVQDGAISRGTMRFRGTTLCFEYEGEGVTGGCFEVWQRGPNCFDFYAAGGAAGAVGTSADLMQKRAGAGWDARGWIDGETKTCESVAIS